MSRVSTNLQTVDRVDLGPKADEVVPDYFAHARSEIAPLLPSRAPSTVLEIGCSSGATLLWLKQRFPNATMIGIDGFEGVRSVLGKNADRCYIHDLESGLPDLDVSAELILALDILEHLKEPEAMLRELLKHLAPGGRMIISLPNIGHHSVVRGLLKGRFDYVDAGILDRTHLRFFTQHSMLRMFERCGLRVVGTVRNMGGRKSKIIDLLTLGRARHFLTAQYIMALEVEDRLM